MNLVRCSYSRLNQIKGYFDEYPNSTVQFKRIKGYYFVYNVHWSTDDPPVDRSTLEKMEWLLNIELGFEKEYQKRKRFHS
ncbi:hypothetical protein [Falsibacillus pallidus]|uniref:Uncharacterized protein n=1 Tax=Falsibacillus pallidus TaxID=493781 RepID=A0A370GTZ7_9BACI|nr:hypothetical protein [Falsibacillus pallidus]RDI45413.1 hypothetical protein DFR59_10237 [Falsibacillus pallidus]